MLKRGSYEVVALPGMATHGRSPRKPGVFRARCAGCDATVIVETPDRYRVPDALREAGWVMTGNRNNALWWCGARHAG